jgi:glucose/arabinose dehydrogenase
MKTLFTLFFGLLFVLSACTPAVPAALPARQATLEAVNTQSPSAVPAKPGAPAANTQPAPPTAPPASTQPPQPTAAPTIAWQQIANGLVRPTDLADPGDGSGRLLVLEQVGRIRVLKDGTVLPQPFLDIQSQVGSNGNEQGLLGIALHPKFKDNGYFFVNYTDGNGNTVIARFTASKDFQSADPASQKVLIQVQQPFPNHNGGSMVFGPDGYLYMGLGDGGSQGDPHLNGQNPNTFLGKILRIDVDQGQRYAIPKGNPFASGGGLPEVFEYGLRNPWRFNFDRQTNDLYIADVGQNEYEEINFVPAGSPGGLDFGWSFREGLHAYKGTTPAGAKLVDPVWEYSHAEGCSITGGFVYRGGGVPGLDGKYIYGDYCSGKVWTLQRDGSGKWSSQVLMETQDNLTSFGQDQAGELYMLDQRGSVFKLVKK